jgi:hypothetical protein
MNGQTARIVQTANDLQFYSPYDQLLVADLKSRIPTMNGGGMAILNAGLSRQTT